MPLKDYNFEEDTFTVTDDMQECFNNNGYLLLRGLLSHSELNRVMDVVEDNSVIDKFAYGNKDDKDRESRLCLWNHPGNDVTGMVARCSKVAGTCAKLLSGEVYHYHTKLMMKEAKTGGSFVWHQDYGYWYRNGCLFPDMMTVFIALDKCTRENGCLQILSGSHLCGRVEHGIVGRQIGADVNRVSEISKVCEHLYVELNPGDALYFHGNVLHTSSANMSSMRRWALLCAYNKASNNPVMEHLHPYYTPLTQVANTAIMECPVPWDATGKDLVTKDRRERFVMAS
ncbi:L-proline trans-4-hydroxylase-like isoform X2 [Haliotis asinina]|uniref:L-proline trans-4-hydroxylase-like isoform X2 n=1 Tax=Haliotis asinina TaxID=109174 RepID=UPI003531CED8